MLKKGHGKIINICSMMSELGRETVSAYAAAKGGLKMLTRNICSEYGEVMMPALLTRMSTPPSSVSIFAINSVTWASSVTSAMYPCASMALLVHPRRSGHRQLHLHLGYGRGKPGVRRYGLVGHVGDVPVRVNALGGVAGQSLVQVGAGTASYTFIWAMGGENQAFDDMDTIPTTALK